MSYREFFSDLVLFLFIGAGFGVTFGVLELPRYLSYLLLVSISLYMVEVKIISFIERTTRLLLLLLTGIGSVVIVIGAVLYLDIISFNPSVPAISLPTAIFIIIYYFWNALLSKEKFILALVSVVTILIYIWEYFPQSLIGLITSIIALIISHTNKNIIISTSNRFSKLIQNITGLKASDRMISEYNLYFEIVHIIAAILTIIYIILWLSMNYI